MKKKIAEWGHRFDGSLKPMCWGCFRRLYGVAKGDGWWCSNCDQWVVRPRRRTNSARHKRSVRDMGGEEVRRRCDTDVYPCTACGADTDRVPR